MVFRPVGVMLFVRRREGWSRSPTQQDIRDQRLVQVQVGRSRDADEGSYSAASSRHHAAA
eukprot:1214389-Heterocapsa_arctica.AAC.1